MTCGAIHRWAPATFILAFAATGCSNGGVQVTRDGQPAQLDIRPAAEHSIRVTLAPLGYEGELPFTPSLAADRAPADPVISLREIGSPVERSVGNLHVTVSGRPLTVEVRDSAGNPIQKLIFDDSGKVSFDIGGSPVLGMGEGGPPNRSRDGEDGSSWRTAPIEFDRRGRFHEMRPRWQSGAYGSRNPVPLLVGTSGWALYVATPWVQVDLTDANRGTFIPWQRPPEPAPLTHDSATGDAARASSTPLDSVVRDSLRRARRAYIAQTQGRPPASQPTDVFDAFIFDARDPAAFMKDVSVISGPAVMPPKWALGYMQSHRELRDAKLSPEELILSEVATFRRKKIPVDAVIYLGTGFTPTGWNTEQPSFDFNPKVFTSDPKSVIDEMHDQHVKVVVHIVPWERDELPTLHGTIPPKPDEKLDSGHIANYWQQHVGLVRTGVDAWWPDEGDWFDLYERVKRHQLYYQGPLSTTPNVRPWSLHRNGYLGVARWGGWIWSGDTESSWKTLEGQIAVGINHSLSLTPYWGSDILGFYTTDETSAELYTRWFQFAAFTPSFRAHGRIWRLRLPWGWGLSDMGYHEGQKVVPPQSEMNNPKIEPIFRKYDELRYQLIPYTYTLAREAHDTGMPLMRALWLHYPDDEKARAVGDEYLWGRDLLVAPVYSKGATSRDVYLPKGDWYDWWTHEEQSGGQTVTRKVDLATMPIYVRAGAIIPVDPVRQYMAQKVDEPTTLQIFSGADGSFTMYEDDGTSLDYLKGRGTWTRFTWDDDAKRLTIEPGAPAGAPNVDRGPRVFRVRLLPEGATKTVRYSGSRAEVTF
ncbi:MAG TPA: TIM-barrel domain-containing protein [Gemmatimonadaceae bacterium]|nr:TIM-barrel domain-containing protein [Gemmatimonadaceae bacterium]